MTGILARLAGLTCLLLIVVACTGTDSSLGVGQKDGSGDAAASAQFPVLPGDTAATTSQTAAASASATNLAAPEIGRVHFAPIVGAPVEKVSALSRQLGPSASAKGVRLVNSDNPERTHEIKGYFSAFSENGSTTVVHVWDVLTPTGQRAHRIQGQEQVSGANDDPWQIVPAATMEAIADKVIAEYAAWRASGV
jgi:hypothetical protein